MARVDGGAKIIRGQDDHRVVEEDLEEGEDGWDNRPRTRTASRAEVGSEHDDLAGLSFRAEDIHLGPVAIVHGEAQGGIGDYRRRRGNSSRIVDPDEAGGPRQCVVEYDAQAGLGALDVASLAVLAVHEGEGRLELFAVPRDPELHGGHSTSSPSSCQISGRDRAEGVAGKLRSSRDVGIRKQV